MLYPKVLVPPGVPGNEKYNMIASLKIISNILFLLYLSRDLSISKKAKRARDCVLSFVLGTFFYMMCLQIIQFSQAISKGLILGMENKKTK